MRELIDLIAIAGPLILFASYVLLCLLLPISAYSAQKHAHACQQELRKLNATMDRLARAINERLPPPPPRE